MPLVPTIKHMAANPAPPCSASMRGTERPELALAGGMRAVRSAWSMARSKADPFGCIGAPSRRIAQRVAAHFRTFALGIAQPDQRSGTGDTATMAWRHRVFKPWPAAIMVERLNRQLDADAQLPRSAVRPDPAHRSRYAQGETVSASSAYGIKTGNMGHRGVGGNAVSRWRVQLHTKEVAVRHSG
jgi:hypothetical protein